IRFWKYSCPIPKSSDSLAAMTRRYSTPSRSHLPGFFLRGMGALLMAGIALCLCACNGAWNNPYPEAPAVSDTLYSAFTQRPKHLDPARSYSVNEVVFTGQIYEPPLQYAYLKSPYTLEPLSATEVPEPQYLNASGQPLPDDAPSDEIAYTVYTIHLKHGLYYQPHPAFARGQNG